MKIALINNKGGTGKTTTCVNVGACLGAVGSRVLIVDLDAQASASLSLGVSFQELSPSVSDVLFNGLPAAAALRPTTAKGVEVLTGGMALASADLVLADLPGRENKLSRALAGIAQGYDYIFFDCPPSLSMLSINALVAADACLIPVTAEYLALEGLIGMLRAVDEAKKGLGINPLLLGIAFTMVIRGLNSAREIIRLVREQYGGLVFNTEIPRSVKLSEAPSFGSTILQHAPRSTGAESYQRLTDEVRQRCSVSEPKAALPATNDTAAAGNTAA